MTRNTGVALRARLHGSHGREYWRSLDELAGTPEFRDYLHREFPENASEWLDPVGRRGFLKLMGASLALAGVSACTRQPDEIIVPYVRQPEELVPGKPLFFATALRAAHRMRDGRSALDVVVTLASFVAVPVLFGWLPRWWTFAILALCAIRNFNCAAQLVHESDHGTLFRDPRLNRSLGNLFAHLLGYTRTGHRAAHMDHHLYLNTDRDPDIIFSQPDASAAAMLKGLLSDLFFVSAIKRLLQYSQSDRATYSVSPWRRLTARYFGSAEELHGAESRFCAALARYIHE